MLKFMHWSGVVGQEEVMFCQHKVLSCLEMQWEKGTNCLYCQIRQRNPKQLLATNCLELSYIIHFHVENFKTHLSYCLYEKSELDCGLFLPCALCFFDLLVLYFSSPTQPQCHQVAHGLFDSTNSLNFIWITCVFQNWSSFIWSMSEFLS